MPRIAFIGAGSRVFTYQLIRDILTFPLLKDSILILEDIDKKRLERSRQLAQAIIEKGNYPARVKATLSQKEALKGADIVICSILHGGVEIWRYDIEIPKKYGVDVAIGDSRGVSGIFRALRTIPVMLEICRDIERYCPRAILLNYTNPMGMICRALQRSSSIQVVGLCHSIQGTIRKLANWIGASLDQITFLAAGINHQAWIIEFKKDGKDAYPLLRKVLKEREITEDIVRKEMFFYFGYFLSESSAHNSEYNWWFRKRPELIEKYFSQSKHGKHASYLKAFLAREECDEEPPISLEKGEEYAADIINALEGGNAFEFYGNIPNTGIVLNLPQGACVEVPIIASRRGFNPIQVGCLPPQCAALTNINIAVEEMAVEAALTGDPTLVLQAVAYDPLTAAVLSLSEIRKMVRELFQKNQNYLPQFKKIKI